MSLTCPCYNSSLQNVRCLNVEDVLQQSKELKIQWYNLVICIWRHRAASAAMSFPLVCFSSIATCVLVPLLHGGFKVGCSGNRLDHRSQAYEKVMDLIVMSMLRLGCLLLVCLKGTKSQNTDYSIYSITTSSLRHLPNCWFNFNQYPSVSSPIYNPQLTSVSQKNQLRGLLLHSVILQFCYKAK